MALFYQEVTPSETEGKVLDSDEKAGGDLVHVGGDGPEGLVAVEVKTAPVRLRRRSPL